MHYRYIGQSEQGKEKQLEWSGGEAESQWELACMHVGEKAETVWWQLQQVEVSGIRMPAGGILDAQVDAIKRLGV